MSNMDPRIYRLNADALAEIKATVDGDSDQDVGHIIYGLLDEIAALTTNPPQASVSVAVRALEWKDDAPFFDDDPDSVIYSEAEGAGYTYIAEAVDCTLEEAKAACQAEFERRILAALTPAPQPEGQEWGIGPARFVTKRPALTPAPDAALEAYGLEKVREGMRMAADIANVFCQVGQIGADIRAAILAEMEKLK